MKNLNNIEKENIQSFLIKNIKNNELNIYIHIPFCNSKCFYCDFVSFTKNKTIQKDYIKALIKQIETENFNIPLKNNCYGLNKFNFNKKISSIYIGGGTPSILDIEDIENIFKAIRGKFNLSTEDILKIPEITIEANPESLSIQKLQAYKKLGITRISIGLQSTSNFLLKKIGRIHNYKQFKNIYFEAKKYFKTNIDLMFGLPFESLNDVKRDLREIKKLEPDSVSLYSFILENGTVFGNTNTNLLKLPNEKTERFMHSLIQKYLKKIGYLQYEISNFAKKNYESKYNLSTWNQNEYLGYGLNASSYINFTRFNMTDNLEKYINYFNLNKKDIIYIISEIQNIENILKEHPLLGLRKKIYDTYTFYAKFNCKFEDIFYTEIKELLEKKLIDQIKYIKNSKEYSKISLTKYGENIANYVWTYFI